MSALEQTEQRIRKDFTTALGATEERFTKKLEQSEQRIRKDVSNEIEQSDYRLLIEIEKSKVATLRWMVGGLIGLSFIMVSCVVGAIIGLVP